MFEDFSCRVSSGALYHHRGKQYLSSLNSHIVSGLDVRVGSRHNVSRQEQYLTVCMLNI